MSFSSRVRKWIVTTLVWGFALVAGGRLAVGQNSSQVSASANDEQPATQAGSIAGSPPVSLSTGEIMNTKAAEGRGNLNSGPPISGTEYSDGARLPEQAKEYTRQMLYGISLASAYFGDYPGLGMPSHFSTTISPYLGLIMPTRTGGLVLQYDGVINPHDTTVVGNEAQAYQALSLTVQGALSRGWSWSLVSSAGYGSEATRVEGPLVFTAVQNTPILNASSTVLLPATNLAVVANTAGLVFQKDERNSFGFTLSHTYTGIEGIPNDPKASGQHLSALRVQEDYHHVMSTRLTLLGYADQETVLSGPGCYSFGGGAGVSARLSRALTLDARGGPQFTSAGCGNQQDVNFSVVLADNLNNKDRIYVSASRVFAPQYQARATWQDELAAGFAKNTRRVTFFTDAGCVLENKLAAVPYHGFFVAPRLHFRLVNSLGATAGYRAFRITGGGLPSGVVNYAAVSLEWYPAGLRLK